VNAFGVRWFQLLRLHVRWRSLCQKQKSHADFQKALDSFDIHAAANIVWKHITDTDQLIQDKAPFKLVKTDRAAAAVEIIKDLCVRLYTIGLMLNPLLPATSNTIRTLVHQNRMPDMPLFLRKE
jgi:methionyl-tRNA synthetase